MNKYRGRSHRVTHPKLFVFSHTQKAEIEYFQEFKLYLQSSQLVPHRKIQRRPQQLIEKVIDWKKKEGICEDDRDQVWCVFDVDEFYKLDSAGFLKGINSAHKHGIKIAYANECFELWILLHLKKITVPPNKRSDYETEIGKAFKKAGLGTFQKNQKCFDEILKYQQDAIKNAKDLIGLKSYDEINWQIALSPKGNPSTSIHLLIEEIFRIHGL